MQNNIANKIDTIANHIMEHAFHRGGTFNRSPIGYGYEELSDKERWTVLQIIEKYGETKDCIPCCWTFDRYTLNEKGMNLHEEYGNYLKYLLHKEQERQDTELDRKLKHVSITTAEETVRLAKEANDISREANQKAEYANDLSACSIRNSKRSNWIALGALIISIISLIATILFQVI